MVAKYQIGRTLNAHLAAISGFIQNSKGRGSGDIEGNKRGRGAQKYMYIGTIGTDTSGDLKALFSKVSSHLKMVKI